MLAGVLVAVLIAIAGGPQGSGSDSNAGSTPRAAAAAAITAKLSPGQLAGQRLILRILGTKPSSLERRLIARGKAAGVILYKENLPSERVAKRLIRRLQAIKRPAPLRDVPLLVMVDQEGGLVERLPGPPSMSAEAMGAAGERTSRRQGLATGRYLSRLGFNVNLAPVLDVGRPGSDISVTHRAFSTDPEAVGRLSGAFARGLELKGVTPTAKHFPGIGMTIGNTDSSIQRITLPKRKLRAIDEVPYRAYAPGARRLVMLSSATYTAFGPRPAVMTRSLIEGELRDRLGFEGVTVTDAMGTVSILAEGPIERTSVLAARAGADLLMYLQPTDLEQAHVALRRALRAKQIRGGAMKQSARRVLTLASSL